MALMKWKDAYSVQIEEIDNDHKKLIELINELHTAMRLRKTDSVLENILSELSNYASYHFKKEEDYFDAFNYEETEEHTRTHQLFIKKITKIKTDFAAGKYTVTMDLMKFLNRWLVEHIMGTDKKYIQCFHDNGIPKI